MDTRHTHKANAAASNSSSLQAAGAMSLAMTVPGCTEGTSNGRTAPVTTAMGTAAHRYWASAAATQQLLAQRQQRGLQLHHLLSNTLSIAGGSAGPASTKQQPMHAVGPRSASPTSSGGLLLAASGGGSAAVRALQRPLPVPLVTGAGVGSPQGSSAAQRSTVRGVIARSLSSNAAAQASAAASCWVASNLTDEGTGLDSQGERGRASSSVHNRPSHSQAVSGCSTDDSQDSEGCSEDGSADGVAPRGGEGGSATGATRCWQDAARHSLGRPPRAPSGSAGAGAAGVVTAGPGPDGLLFWGGLKARRPSPGGSDQPDQQGRSGTPGGSRPGTASSYWSNYDLEEGALERLGALQDVPAKNKITKPRKPKDHDRPLGGPPSLSRSLSRSNSAGGSACQAQRRSPAHLAGGGANGVMRCEPYVRVMQPAVIMDLALITPCTRPLTEIPLDDKGRPYPYVLPPTFTGAYPTMAFMGSAAIMQAAGLHPLMRARMLVRYAGIANSPVKAAFREAGWRVARGAKSKWSVCWGHIFTAEEFAPLHEFQRVNHFPGTWELGRKDYLYRNVAALRRSKGDALDFIPRFYLLPRDYDEYRADLDRHPGRLYIQKPTNSSRGRGVRMVVKPADVSRDVKDLLVQHYVHNPYTINGYKFDMRIYVLASCIDPLRLYVYSDGLARFATERYSDDKADLKKRCVHLTNYSVNKKSSKFVANDEAGEAGEASGSKWSLAALRAHVEGERGRTAWAGVWRQVHDIVAGALLAAEPKISTEVRIKVPHRNICFEVWGFDVLLDEELRAWLIEVNTCPSLAGDSPLDRRVKTNMVADAMHLVGPVPYDPEVHDAWQEAKRQSRLTGLAIPSPVGQGAAGPASSRAGAGAASGGGIGPPQVPRTVQEAQQLDLRGLSNDQLPDLVVEAEAELARARGWERVFPCTQDPGRYLNLFETPRASSIMLSRYYAQKQGTDLTPRPSTTSPATPSSGKGRPSINNWRPSGTS